MSDTPTTIEMQIDNFLEQFKRSASKAMDGEWTVNGTGPSSAAGSSQNGNGGAMIRSKSRNSMDITELAGEWKNR
jgi:pleckstrin homology domain-containing family G member 4